MPLSSSTVSLSSACAVPSARGRNAAGKKRSSRAGSTGLPILGIAGVPVRMGADGRSSRGGKKQKSKNPPAKSNAQCFFLTFPPSGKEELPHKGRKGDASHIRIMDL